MGTYEPERPPCAWSSRSESISDTDLNRSMGGGEKTSSRSNLLALLTQLSEETNDQNQQSQDSPNQYRKSETTFECGGCDTDLDLDFLTTSVFYSPPISAYTPASTPSSGRSLSPDVQILKPMKPGRFYRSKSLRSALRSQDDTITQLPNKRKKMVRFADALGLDLEHIRNIVADDHQFSLANKKKVDSAEQLNIGVGGVLHSWNNKFLVQCFSLPPARNTDRLLDKQQVALESCTVADLALTGVIKVKNIGYHKSVTLRYTLDDWHTQQEMWASYIPRSSDGFIDKFVFSLFLPQDIPAGSVCQFAIKYEVLNQCYWDNNEHANYAIQVCTNRGHSQPAHFTFPSYMDCFY